MLVLLFFQKGELDISLLRPYVKKKEKTTNQTKNRYQTVTVVSFMWKQKLHMDKIIKKDAYQIVIMIIPLE